MRECAKSRKSMPKHKKVQESMPKLEKVKTMCQKVRKYGKVAFLRRWGGGGIESIPLYKLLL